MAARSTASAPCHRQIGRSSPQLADGTVRLWDLEEMSAYNEPLIGHRGTVWGICQVPDDSGYAASPGADSTVRVWNVLAGLRTGSPMTDDPNNVDQ
jgi:WD40 repeat protein